MNSIKGKLYGVGVGPGDPKLITLKAVEIIGQADFIALADTCAGSENIALNIVKDYAVGKPLIACPMPMTRDEDKLASSRNKSALIIKNILDGGKSVAFITLGDPTVYSTYMYIHRIIAADGYDTEIIPGVTSFCAAAAALGESLCDGGQTLTVIPASYEGVDDYLKMGGTKVLMKSGKSFSSVREKLTALGLNDKSMMVEKCGMQGERKFRNIDEVVPEGDFGGAGYFSIIIVKE